MVFDLRDLDHPLIVAPMAGGPSTPNLRLPVQPQAASASSRRAI